MQPQANMTHLRAYFRTFPHSFFSVTTSWERFGALRSPELGDECSAVEHPRRTNSSSRIARRLALSSRNVSTAFIAGTGPDLNSSAHLRAAASTYTPPAENARLRCMPGPFWTTRISADGGPSIGIIASACDCDIKRQRKVRKR